MAPPTTRRSSVRTLRSKSVTIAAPRLGSIVAKNSSLAHIRLNKSNNTNMDEDADIDLGKDEEALSSILCGCCPICGEIGDMTKLLLCDGEGCDSEYHMTCLNPKLKEVPDGEWLCPNCSPEITKKDLIEFEDKILVANCALGGENPKDTKVKIMFSGRPFQPPSMESRLSFRFLQRLKKANCAEDLVEEDFEDYHCFECKNVGEVIFCGTCVNTYHYRCLPNGPAKFSFGKIEGVWRCHRCLEYGSKAPQGIRSQRSRKKCIVCKKIGKSY